MNILWLRDLKTFYGITKNSLFGSLYGYTDGVEVGEEGGMIGDRSGLL